MSFASDLFDSLNPVPATYADSAGSFALRMAVQELDKAFRLSRRDRLIGSAVTGAVLTDARIRRGGKITTASAVFRVDGVHAGSPPGLSDLALERLEGAAAAVFDMSDVVPLDEEVEIGGRTIPANVNRSVEIEEVGRDGTRLVVSRIMVAVRALDAFGVKSGDKITFDGRTRSIARAMNGGVGLMNLLV